MPHFDEHGNDVALCQVCGGDTTKPTWRPDITGSKSAGNVCPRCLERHEEAYVFTRGGAISLYEHCKRESGFTEHRKIVAYMNRHYGHD